MNLEQIGIDAGKVWQILDKADAMTVKQLKKEGKFTDKTVYAAIGWLAREGKINVLPSDEDPKEVMVSLVQDK